MTRITKNRKLSLEKYDAEKIYSISEASKIVKEISTTKFDASIDLDVRLGVDPKKADQIPSFCWLLGVSTQMLVVF